ncbi:S-adenosyl-L-methionine-dependent methyltransferases superfamily protein [Raphanus sativus]|nr:S-adenosyl-L-methionine-dependent methyltransferases superfamily protein [Raphanus sativus]
MAALSEKEAEAYLDARPRYPVDWYKKIAARTQDHKSAWDVGTGNGQAAIGLIEHYENVVATDINEVQLKRAIKHSRINYHQTPKNMSEDEMVALIGGENSIDLIVAAQAARRQPVSVPVKALDTPPRPSFESAFPQPKPRGTTGLARPGTDTGRCKTCTSVYRVLEIMAASDEAKEQGVELVNEDLITKFKEAWGDENQVKDVFYKAYMIVGKFPEVRCESEQVSEDGNKDLLHQTEVGRKQERRQPSDEESRQIKKQNTSEDEAC